jgi:hypothetical protein
MKDVNKIIILTSLTGLLTISLFGFTLLNQDKFTNAGQEGKALLYCGTVALSNEWAIENDPKASYGEALFKANCKACHSLDRELVGPALRNIYDYRDSLWITKMIINGNQLMKRNDKIAVELYKEYSNTQHTEFTSLKNKDVDALMHYLKAARQPVQ